MLKNLNESSQKLLFFFSRLVICVTFFTFAEGLKADLIDDVNDDSAATDNKAPVKPENKSETDSSKPKKIVQPEVKGPSSQATKGAVNTNKALPPKGQKNEPKSGKERRGGKDEDKGDGIAGSAAKDQQPQKEPIFFKSDGRSTYTKAGDVIILEKNVLITQAKLRFRADAAKVFLEKVGDVNSVRMAEFNGHVDVTKSSDDPAEEVTANGNKAQFYNDKRKVELVGNAHLWRGGHLIKGKQITYFIDTGMITVDEAQGVVKPENAKKK